MGEMALVQLNALVVVRFLTEPPSKVTVYKTNCFCGLACDGNLVEAKHKTMVFCQFFSELVYSLLIVSQGFIIGRSSEKWMRRLWDMRPRLHDFISRRVRY